MNQPFRHSPMPGLRAALLGLACLALGNGNKALADGPSQAARLKAAFVFNFTKYTDWPAASFPSADAPLWLCLFRTDSDTGQALRDIEGKTSRGRSLKLRQVDGGSDLKTCHVLFIESDPGLPLRRTLSALGAAPVLTVSDGESFASRGGMIEFETRGQRLGFAINLDATKRSGLRLSAQLLSLARIVKDS